MSNCPHLTYCSHFYRNYDFIVIFIFLEAKVQTKVSGRDSLAERATQEGRDALDRDRV